MANFLKNHEVVKCYNSRKRPMLVSWDVTNRCNFSCLHCFNSSGDATCYNFSEELTEEQVINVAWQIRTLRPDQCCLCGGETLLFPYLFSVIKILSDGDIVTNLVTNGYLITRQIAKKLKKAGVAHVQISIDGLGIVHDQFRNTPGSFARAVQAIGFLHEVGITTMVSFCPNITNYLQLEDYVRFIDTLKCKHIRMMPLLPLGRGHNHYNQLKLDSEQIFDLVQRISKLREQYPHMQIEWGDPLEHIFLVLTTRRKYPVIMSIQSNGNLSITPYIPIVVGNVKKRPLQEYWEAGYSKIWADKRILDIIKGVNSLYDLPKLNSKEYYFEIVEEGKTIEQLKYT